MNAPDPARSAAAVVAARLRLVATGANDLDADPTRNTGFTARAGKAPGFVEISRTQGIGTRRDYFYAGRSGYRQWEEGMSAWRAALVGEDEAFEIVSPGPDVIVACHTPEPTAQQRPEVTAEMLRVRAFLDARHGARNAVDEAETAAWGIGLTGENSPRVNRLVLHHRTVAAFLDLITAKAGTFGGPHFAAHLRAEGTEILREMVLAVRTGGMPRNIGRVFEYAGAGDPSRDLVLGVADAVTAAVRTLSDD